jgi:hypothetical protein
VPKFLVHAGWQLKPKVTPYLFLSEDNNSTNYSLYYLLTGEPITIDIKPLESKYCVGYSSSEGERIPCPKKNRVPLNQTKCSYCSREEFYLCRIYCIGDFCHPSSEEAREYCWSTNAYTYLTVVAGKLKVGSSTNPKKRWLGQGSTAGITIAKGKGLNPRALEHHIGKRFGYKLAIRKKTKMDYLGDKENKTIIAERMEGAINKVYQNISSEILYPKNKLKPITWLTDYYGGITGLTSRPISKELTKKGLTLSGEIVGVKGSLLVVKNNNTYNICNLHSLIGTEVTIKKELSKIKGQRSLFDFVQ